MSGGGGGGGVATFKSIAERRDPNGCGLSVAQTHGPPETKKIDSISFFYQMENFLLFFFHFFVDAFGFGGAGPNLGRSRSFAHRIGEPTRARH